MIMLDSFDTLLQAAREQPERQRFLLVFVKTVLPEDATGKEAQRFESGLGGGLVPVMCVDKAEDELDDFASLVSESRQMSEAWDMVLVGCMAGHNGRQPTSAEAEEPLNNIVNAIRVGSSLKHLAAFDRRGEPLRFE